MHLYRYVALGAMHELSTLQASPNAEKLNTVGMRCLILVTEIVSSNEC